MIITILVTTTSILGILIYQIRKVNNPIYKLNRLENRSEEIYKTIIQQIKDDIQEPYMKRYNEYHLQIVQQKKKEFITFKEINKSNSTEEKIDLHQNWLNYLLSVYRPKHPSSVIGSYREYFFRSNGHS